MQLQSGDQTAWKEFIDVYKLELCRYIQFELRKYRQWVPATESFDSRVDSVFNAALIKFMERIGSLSADSLDASAYFKSVICNHLIDRFRKLDRRREVALGLLVHSSGEALGPEANLLNRDFAGKIISSVPPDDKRALEGLKNGETVSKVARQMSKTRGWLHRLLDKLKQRWRNPDAQ